MADRILQTGDKYRRYRHPRRIQKWIIPIFIIVFLVGFGIRMHCTVSALLISVSEEDIRLRTATAVNGVALRTMSGNAVDYGNLVRITRDSSGNIQSIETNAPAINSLARNTQELSTAELKKVCAEGIRVPLGAFTGMDILSGSGPEITFRVLPVGTVSCRFFSDFKQAGINQTKHSVYLLADAIVKILLPGETHEVNVEIPILVCENIIVGKIPDVYLNGGKTG